MSACAARIQAISLALTPSFRAVLTLAPLSFRPRLSPAARCCARPAHSNPMLARALLILGLFSCFQRCLGQKPTFQWKFAGNLVSTALEACRSYPIIVQNRTANASAVGIAPYYLIAFVPNGIPTTSLIGTDPTNLTWTVNQPPGTNMLLTLADSNKDAGGFTPVLYSVVAGQSNACVQPPPAVNVTIVANITGSLATCQQLGLRVYGGSKPYTISLGAPNSPVVTNVTLGANDDVFTYVNRADPNGQLMAAVSDVNGVWGTSTPLFSTTGSTSSECVGLVSTSGNSSFVDQHPKPPSSGPHTALIAGLATAGGILLLAIVAIIVFLHRRRRAAAEKLEPEPAFLPDAWAAPLVVTHFGAPENDNAHVSTPLLYGGPGGSNKERMLAEDRRTSGSSPMTARPSSAPSSSSASMSIPPGAAVPNPPALMITTSSSSSHSWSNPSPSIPSASLKGARRGRGLRSR